ncbi:Thiol-disulfide oxidoreductase resA [Dermatophilus congolensis]|uniref:Thiol-disulfide oxidoreductase resA n=1 Tax=Dermatophilus congolensis TaxID=1863 RepID=A0AA46GZB8_9MICO|nr:TlpA disulfide reductase family protein [Dermatophilus congolensis]STD02889.1 Thiol-disulfide oxidoreductase resA [Dermatophilus congolensis]
MKNTPRTLTTLLLTATLTACSTSGNTIANQARRGDDLGYVTGDGAVQRLPADQRKTPITLNGKLLDGTPWNITDNRGKITVLNIWGSWCQPCQNEAPQLEKARAPYNKDPNIQFIGINVGESPETGSAAAKAWGLTYPSLTDPERKLASSLNGLANATPTTLVIDTQGRVAARISGALATASTLTGLIDDVRNGKNT